MGLDRGRPDPQAVRDLAVDQALRRQDRHLALTHGRDPGAWRDGAFMAVAAIHCPAATGSEMRRHEAERFLWASLDEAAPAMGCSILRNDCSGWN